MTCPDSLRAQLLRKLALDDAMLDPLQAPAQSPIIPITLGRITLLTGPSGCGKTLALKRLLLDRNDESALDDSPFNDSAPDALTLLEASAREFSTRDDWLQAVVHATGLCDARILRTPASKLSTGEQTRVQLALALLRLQAGGILVIDEFCAALDSLRAKALAALLAKLAAKHTFACVIATHRSEVIPYLNPAHTLDWQGAPPSPHSLAAPLSTAQELPDQLEIEPARKRDWPYFARHHHRAKKLGPIATAFVAKIDGEAIAMIVYAFPGLSCSLRKHALPAEFSQASMRERAHALNRDLRVLQRLVVLPAFRGLGIGAALARATLPRVGAKYVESIATDPRVLVSAGMSVAGATQPAPRARRLLGLLREFDFSPQSLNTAEHRAALFAQLPSMQSRSLERALLAALREYIESHHGHLRAALSDPRTRSKAHAHIPQMLLRITSSRSYLIWQAARSPSS